MNIISIIGNITKDPEVRKVRKGSDDLSVSNFTVAVNGRGDSVEFIRVTCWRKLAELCGQYLSKGRKVGVTGSLQSRRWTDDDGCEHEVWEILADSVDFLTSPKKEEQQDAPQKQQGSRSGYGSKGHNNYHR